MLEYSKFKEILCEEIQKKLSIDGYNFELKVEEINTINEKKDKLSVIEPLSPAAFPVFYINDIYKYYSSCGDIYGTINDVVDEIKETYINLPKVDINRDVVINNVFFTLVNYDKNKELLNTIPHRKFQDLAITYKLMVTDSLHATITNKVMDNIGMDEKELYNYAYVNTPNILGRITRMEIDDWYLKGLGSILGNGINFNNEFEINYKDDNELDEKMIVFKYENTDLYGSSIILYNDEIEKAAEMFNDDLVMIFPTTDMLVVSSIKNDMEEINELCNNISVPAQKFLSSNKYIYDKKLKTITIQEDSKAKSLDSNINRKRGRR